MKRSSALEHIKEAGYHGDLKAMLRLYIENRVSYESAKKSFSDGEMMKSNGVKCNCFRCKEIPAQESLTIPLA